MIMAVWRDFADLYPGPGHTVVGTIKVCEQVYSPQLDNSRRLLVYLPPSYAQGTRRYPVIYMHDGQNLFDAALSFSGEWQVDETLEALSAEGIEAVVVGIPNLDGEVAGARLDEYGPFPSVLREGRGGRGADYVAFIAETIKPLIDADFRTLPDRGHTSIAGSSMGGLISLYAFFTRPDVFSRAGVFSPAFWFTAEDAIFNYVQNAAFAPGKIYLDVGTAELDHIPPENRGQITSAIYRDDARRMRDLLLRKGYQPARDLLYVEEEGAPHHESAWARRLPAALRFLLAE
jgi:predicted alpha/beta superfamily hydrolase